MGPNCVSAEAIEFPRPWDQVSVTREIQRAYEEQNARFRTLVEELALVNGELESLLHGRQQFMESQKAAYAFASPGHAR